MFMLPASQGRVNQPFLTALLNSPWRAMSDSGSRRVNTVASLCLSQGQTPSPRMRMGVLLSVVLDAPANNSYLLLLDACDLSEMARATVPQHVPFGFHGAYIRS
jgi:hypothetical protein